MEFVSVLPIERHAKASRVCLFILLVLAGCSWREEKTTVYPNGQIRIRWHERMIGPYRTIKDGKYEAFYPTGARLASGEFMNGDSVGMWEEWYLYGGKRYEKTYSPQSKLTGRSIVWMPNGDTLAVHTYNEMGEPDGRQVVYWHDTGGMQEEGEFKGGKRNGPWQAWYRNGQTKYEREYDAGRCVGTWTDFGPDGHVASRREYQRELPPELAREWGTALVEGVPVGRAEDFQRRERTVDTIPAQERVYGELRLRGQEWVVPYKWISPRFEVFYKPRYDTLIVWKPSPPPARPY